MSHRRIPQRIAFIVAIVLAIVLLLSALGKILYPLDIPNPWKMISLWIAIFEIFFAFLLVRFYYVPGLWNFTAFILAGWGGYSLFWCIAKLPCGCMGKMLNLPNGSTLGFDIFFLSLSLFLAAKLSRRLSFLLFLASAIAAIIGYFIASQFFFFL